MTPFPSAHHLLSPLLAAVLAAAPATVLAQFSTSFETGEPLPPDVRAGPVQVMVGSGPASPYAAKAGVGYSGRQALRYRGDGTGGRLRLFAVDVTVTENTTLDWMVLPEIVAGDDPLASTLVSTGVSLDVVFDDGKRLSELDVRDQHGVRLGAAAQARSHTLYPQQWAHKQVRLGNRPELAGRLITAIELEVVPVGGGSARGWIDDVVLSGQPPVVRQRPSEYVLTTRGTQSGGTFSRGNTIPATAVPHGFNFWIPVTDAGTLFWPYRWHADNDADNRPRLQAFALSHQPSPWMGDRQTVQVMPSIQPGIPEIDREKRALAFSRANETARPHHYAVAFDNGIRVDMAPTDHAAILRFRFPAGSEASVLFDNVDARGGLVFNAQTQTVSGYSDTRSGLSNGATRLFVYARFDRPWTGSGLFAAAGRPGGYVRFGAVDEVNLRMATSLLSVEQARRNLQLEIGAAGFEAVRETAQTVWDAVLGRVQITGATEDQLVTVYSSLYRLFLYPNSAHENVGSADAPDWRHAVQSGWEDNRTGGTADETSAAIVPGKIYVNNGFWDTFRTAWPAYALFAPHRAGELVDGFLQHFRDGGWVPRWSAPGYADLMVGTSSDVAFADAAVKGVAGFDPHAAYAAALRNATVVPPSRHVGRKGLARSLYRGYTDSAVPEGLSWTLDGALNDFGIANLAAWLAARETDPRTAQRYREEAEYFRIRAGAYGTLFDHETGFFRGKTATGQWRQPAAEFDPRRWGGDYTEANAWNFAFTAVHDGAGLAYLHGGRDALANKLDAFFTTPETAEQQFSGSYGHIIHEMTEARDVRMGMYAHSNQPAHHIPWLYLYAGQPWKTQRITREVMQRLYLGSEIGQGYVGDEDNGELSAWYLFAMLGLYPLRAGSDDYVIGSPLFESVQVTLDSGNTLRVLARNNTPDNVYVQSLTVNGKEWKQPWLRHADIANGGTLEFVMGSEPSAWGTGADALPPSLTASGRPPQRWIDHASRARTVTLDNEQPAQALVDDDAATAVALPAGAAIHVHLETPEHIGYYTLTSGRAPLAGLDWIVEGRSDGGWNVLDARTGEDFPWARQLRPFRIQNPGFWQEYRLRFAAATPELELAELELLRTGD